MITRWLCLIALVCILILPAPAQTDQWQDLRKLAPGTPISVVRRVRQDCELVEVTDWELTCDQEIGQVTRRRLFVRDQIREVRLEMPEHNKMTIGAIVGAAVGGLVGLVGGQLSNDPETRGYARAYGIPVGGALGAAIGRRIHRHGAVVYHN